jgi:hypothetical protein
MRSTRSQPRGQLGICSASTKLFTTWRNTEIPVVLVPQANYSPRGGLQMPEQWRNGPTHSRRIGKTTQPFRTTQLQFLSYPHVHTQCMSFHSTSDHGQIISDTGRLVCDWCQCRFDARSPFGPVPRYCKPSHRNRASERRRGLLRPRERPQRNALPTPQSSPQTASLPGAIPELRKVLTLFDLGHEVGRTGMHSEPRLSHTPRSFHRVRPGSVPNEIGLVPSLCGSWVQVHNLPTHLAVGHYRWCRRCEDLAPLHPTEPNWWHATTHRVATGLVDDLRSTELAVKQAVVGRRDPWLTLERVQRQLEHVSANLGRPPTPPPSLHHNSVRCP